MDDVLNRILSLLKENQIEQKAFSNAIGLSPSAVTEWKKGKTKSYNHYIYQIAEYFGVTVEYLLYGENKKAPDLPVRSASEWDAVLSKLSDESLIQLRDYLKYLVWKQDQADLNTE